MFLVEVILKIDFYKKKLKRNISIVLSIFNQKIIQIKFNGIENILRKFHKIINHELRHVMKLKSLIFGV